jgi:hypothetical protein
LKASTWITFILALVLTSQVTSAQAYPTEVRMKKLEWLAERNEWREQVRQTRARLRAAWKAESAAAARDSLVSEVPSVPSASVAGCLTASQVAAYARDAGFPEGLIDKMVAIAYRESHYCPGAVNSSSGACGLWQMYPCPGTHALDPATNAAMAYAKYVGSGYDLDPWGY